jgi:lon-related putative ATP-dependent protease
MGNRPRRIILIQPLSAQKLPLQEIEKENLYHRCDPEQLSFQTTDELDTLNEIIAQERAVDAVRFGIDIPHDGYNIFALGPPGTGKRSLVQHFLEDKAPSESAPDDWCYVNNFDQPYKPVALSLPAGKARPFQQDMDKLIEEVRNVLPSAFENDDYRQQRQSLEEQFKKEQEKAFEDLQDKAREAGLEVTGTQSGLMFVPLKEDGKPMSSEEIQQIPQDKRKELEQKSEELQKEAQRIFQQASSAQREARNKLKEFNQQVAERTIEPLISELREKYKDHQEVTQHLDAVQKDMVSNSEELLKVFQMEQADEQSQQQQMMQQQQAAQRASMPSSMDEPSLLRNYRVNVLVEHDPEKGAPVVYEDNPNYQRVIGRVEHLAHMGALMADFTLIKPGALHRANGGYLILDARKLLTQPYVWEGVKHTLRSGDIRIESLGQALGMISTVSLEPQPIPINVKVILLGSRTLYYLLRELDPDFAELFKVPADFAERMDRGDEDLNLYARLIATLVKKEELKPFDKSGVARVIEHSSRLTGDAKKLSADMRRIADLLCEADYQSRKNGNGAVTADDVQKAIDAQIHRADRIREMMQEEIQRGTIMIDVEGEEVGQLNGLAVLPFGDFFFGRPHRITARTAMGDGHVMDIEREVKLGGPVHSKGVMILSGFLSGRYSRDLPLSLSASLVFEQSYTGVAGDSASSAELYALLSSIAEVPLRQSLAVTGSVNQRGRIQAIGAVNEKIEGFFDVCKQNGLTGEQGVLIPASNVQHLMLRQDIVQAVDQGQFHIYPVENVDQGIELLTGIQAGEADEHGNYPKDSVNGKVARRLEEMAQKRKQFLPSERKDEK